MSDMERELKDLFHGLAETVHEKPPSLRMLRRARRRRLRTAVIAIGVTGVVVYGGFAGADALRGLGRASPTPAGVPSTQSPTPEASSSPTLALLPQAVRLARTFPQQPDLWTAHNGVFFSVSIDPAQTSLSVTRVGTSGMRTDATIRDARATYFFSIAADDSSLYLGTRVIKRFSNASDVLLRLDAHTLAVTGRIALQEEVIAIVASGQRAWVALDDKVLALDPASFTIGASYTVPAATPPPAGSDSFSSLALGLGGLWATFGTAEQTYLDRFDPDGLALLSRSLIPEIGQGISVVASDTALWVVGQNTAQKYDATGRPLARATLVPEISVVAAQGPGLVAVIATGGPNEDLVQVDGAGVVIARSAVGNVGGRMAVDGSDVWIVRSDGLTEWTLLHPLH